MAVDVRITGRGLANDQATLERLLMPGMGYGVLDEAYRLEDGKMGDYMVVYNPENICRGFELSLSDGEAALRLPLPSGWQDVQFFYAFVRELCQKLETDVFVRDDERLNVADIDKYIECDIKTSERVLQQMAENIASGEYENMYLCGVMNPIALDLPTLEEIGGDPRKLDTFMHNLQAQDVYYAKPNIYKRKDESLFGVYTLTEGVATVLPYTPKLMMGSEKLQIDEWNLAMVIDEKLAGFVPYPAFLDFVITKQVYDVEHFIASMNRRQMQRLLAEARVNL